MTPLHILITAGPTREPIDAVRYLSNRSTGRMGICLAEAAIAEGHRVTLVLGPSALTPPSIAETVNVESAADMFHAVESRFKDCDVFISSAAVADYTPSTRFDGKLKKSEGDLTLTLKRTTDILAWAGKARAPSQTLVGFALEADPRLSLAREKIAKKRCDLLIHNSPANFGQGAGAVRICTPQGVIHTTDGADKPALAATILRFTLAHRAGEQMKSQGWE